MAMELPNALDNLAAYGVLDFDSEAYIKGTTPRYVGAQHHVGLPFDEPLMATPSHGPGAQLPAQPHKDEFVKEKEEHETAPWKKYLAVTLASAALIYAAVKFKVKPKAPATQAAGQAATSKFQALKTKVTDLFEKPIKWVKDKITARKAANIARKGLITQPVFNPASAGSSNP